MRQNSHCFSRVKLRCCSKRDPIEGLRDSSLTFRNESSKETHMLIINQDLYWEGTPEWKVTG